MIVREATLNDLDAIWEIFEPIVKAGETYSFGPETTREEAHSLWLTPGTKTFVAEENGKVLGSYFLKANQPGLGSHIANCGYMVHPDARGKGLGKQLCVHSIYTARQMGFKGMQYNLVVSTNLAAVKLWEQCGFKIIGTIPNGFNHKTLGYVDAHIMFREID